MSRGLKFVYELQAIARKYNLTFAVTYAASDEPPMKYWFLYSRRIPLEYYGTSFEDAVIAIDEFKHAIQICAKNISEHVIANFLVDRNNVTKQSQKQIMQNLSRKHSMKGKCK